MNLKKSCPQSFSAGKPRERAWSPTCIINHFSGFFAGEESESESLSGLDEDEIGPGEEADEEDQFEVGDEKDELEEASMIPGQTERKQSKPTLLTVSKTQ